MAQGMEPSGGWGLSQAVLGIWWEEGLPYQKQSRLLFRSLFFGEGSLSKILI